MSFFVFLLLSQTRCLPVRVTVDGTGLSVCGPTGMGDGDRAHKVLCQVRFLLCDELLELLDLADLLVQDDLALAVAIDGHPSGIIPTVFESRETGQKDIDDVLPVALDEVVHIAKDTTAQDDEPRINQTDGKSTYHIIAEFYPTR